MGVNWFRNLGEGGIVSEIGYDLSVQFLANKSEGFLPPLPSIPVYAYGYSKASSSRAFSLRHVINNPSILILVVRGRYSLFKQPQKKLL